MKSIKGWPIANVKELFERHLEFLLNHYESFPNNLRKSEDCLIKLFKKENIFTFFQQFAVNENQKRTLKSVISFPIVYLTRVEEFLRNLFFLYSEKSKSYSKMVQIVATISEFNFYIQENIEKEDYLKVLKLLEKKLSKNDLVSLYQGKRNFIRDRVVLMNDKKAKLFLFSDCLLITIIKNKKLEFHSIHSLMDLNIPQIKKTNNENAQSMSIQYTIQISNSSNSQSGSSTSASASYSNAAGGGGGANTSMEMSCSEVANEFNASLVCLLDDYIKQRKDPVFGVSLHQFTKEKATNHPSGGQESEDSGEKGGNEGNKGGSGASVVLPPIFLKCIYYLDKLNDKSNLFRTPGNIQLVMRLRINEGVLSGEGADLSNCNKDDICTLLIMFLNELPDEIIDYQTLLNEKKQLSDIRVHGNTNGGNAALPSIAGAQGLQGGGNGSGIKDLQGSNNVSNRRNIKKFRKIIQKLTENNRNLLEYLVYFLSRLNQVGKINIQEIALYFTSIIIKIKKEQFTTIEYVRNIGKLLKYTEILILFRDKIFLEKKKFELPKDLLEFYESDTFSIWWKQFRSSNKHFIKFLTTKKIMGEILNHLVISNYENHKKILPSKIQKNEKNEKNEENLKIKKEKEEEYAMMSKSILSNELILHKVAEDQNLLDKFFQKFQNLSENEMNEKTIKNYSEIIILFYKTSVDKMNEYLLKTNKEFSEKIVENIGFGNIDLLLTKLIELSKSNQEIEKILNYWLILIFDKILTSKFNYLNDDLENSINFISNLIHNDHFLNSPHFLEFKNYLNKEKLEKLIKLSINVSDDERTCCLIQNLICNFISLGPLNNFFTVSQGINTDNNEINLPLHGASSSLKIKSNSKNSLEMKELIGRLNEIEKPPSQSRLSSRHSENSSKNQQKSKSEKASKNDREREKEKEKPKESESKTEEKGKDAAEDKKKDEEAENEVVNLQSIDSDSETDDEYDELNESSSIDDQLIETNVKIEESASKNDKSSSEDCKKIEKKGDEKKETESKSKPSESTVNKKQFLSRNTSNSSLRWTNSDTLKLNEAQSTQRTNLLSLFIENHAEISKILLEKTKTFGFCKLGILRIIQFTIFADDSMINQQLTNTNLIDASITVFFNYPKHNIMHHLIQDTICGILERNNESMILYLLNKTSLVDKIFKLLSKHKINQINNNSLPIIPYIHLILDAFYLNKTALAWLNSSKEYSAPWKDFSTSRQAFLNANSN